jgi:hypothetical protein
MGVYVRCPAYGDGAAGAAAAGDDAAVWRRDERRSGGAVSFLYRLDGRWQLGPSPSAPACFAHSLGGDLFSASWKVFDAATRSWKLEPCWSLAHRPAAEEWGGVEADALGGTIAVVAREAAPTDNTVEVRRRVCDCVCARRMRRGCVCRVV